MLGLESLAGASRCIRAAGIEKTQAWRRRQQKSFLWLEGMYSCRMRDGQFITCTLTSCGLQAQLLPSLALSPHLCNGHSYTLTLHGMLMNGGESESTRKQIWSKRRSRSELVGKNWLGPQAQPRVCLPRNAQGSQAGGEVLRSEPWSGDQLRTSL